MTISYYIILYPIISHVPKLQPGTTFMIAPGCNSFESWDSSINRSDHNQLSLHDWYITLYNWKISGPLWPLLPKMKEWWKIRTCSDRRYLFSFSLFSWKRLWLIDSVASWYPSGCFELPTKEGMSVAALPGLEGSAQSLGLTGFLPLTNGSLVVPKRRSTHSDCSGSFNSAAIQRSQELNDIMCTDRHIHKI